MSALDPPPNNDRLNQTSASQVAGLMLPAFPAYPESVKTRFPELAGHEIAIQDWVKKVLFNIRQGVQ